MKLSKIEQLLSSASGTCFAEGDTVLGGANPGTIPPVEVPKTVGDTLYPPAAEKPPVEEKPSEEKPLEEKPAEEKPSEEKPAELPAALKAEDYKFDLPEGVTLAPEADKAFRDLAVGASLSQENASALMKMHVDALTSQSEALVTDAQKNFVELRANWRKEIDAMPEFSGSQRETSLALCARAIEEFGTKETKQMLDTTGLGDNPHIAKLILSMATALAEGAPALEGRPGRLAGKEQRQQPRSLGEALYGNPDQQS